MRDWPRALDRQGEAQALALSRAPWHRPRCEHDPQLRLINTIPTVDELRARGPGEEIRSALKKGTRRPVRAPYSHPPSLSPGSTSQAYLTRNLSSYAGMGTRRGVPPRDLVSDPPLNGARIHMR